MKGLSAKFLIHFEMWRDLKPLGFVREREREREKERERERERELEEPVMEKKGKKRSLTPFREIFKMDRCLRFKKGT